MPSCILALICLAAAVGVAAAGSQVPVSRARNATATASPLFGRLTPQNWGPFMPVQRPIAFQGPWYYRRTESMILELELDADWALSVLPSDLELVQPAAGFFIAETNHWSTLGEYSEVYNGILCRYRGELFAYVPGCYVTGENSQIVGREVYGFGKKRAHRVALSHHTDGSVEAVLQVKPGYDDFRAIVQAWKNEPASAVSKVPLLVLRVIPDAAGSRKPALAELVAVTFDTHPVVGVDGKAEVFSGPGSIKFDSGADANDMYMGVTKVTRGIYAHFQGDLPYGRVIKRYADHELPTGSWES
ncbi:hypothetical protein DFJ74DRAFT_132281 [Hyaloraphidium curvatum]|nr:hypothetical protein DFJ74DRAFT_132281 [Hyaloraphidium curvatum]